MLRTLEGVKEIGGVAVLEIKDRIKPEEYEKALKEGRFVCVNHGANSVAFTFQLGTVKQKGVNGAQVDTIIATAAHMLSVCNEEAHSPEHERAIKYLRRALDALEQHRVNRGDEPRPWKQADSKTGEEEAAVA